MPEIEMKKVVPINEGTMMDYENPDTAIFPSFYLTEADLPEIKNWEVNREYNLHLRVRMKGKGDTPRGIEGRFEMLEVGTDRRV